MTEVKDKLVTAESLKNAYDTLNNKSYEKLDVVYNKTNNSLVFQNTPELPDNVYVDKTLTESGNAADAKVTGDAITELKNETSGLKGDLVNLETTMSEVINKPDSNVASIIDENLYKHGDYKENFSIVSTGDGFESDNNGYNGYFWYFIPLVIGHRYSLTFDLNVALTSSNSKVTLNKNYAYPEKAENPGSQVIGTPIETDAHYSLDFVANCNEAMLVFYQKYGLKKLVATNIKCIDNDIDVRPAVKKDALPIADKSSIGAVKIGDGLSIDKNGVLSALQANQNNIANFSESDVIYSGPGITVTPNGDTIVISNPNGWTKGASIAIKGIKSGYRYRICIDSNVIFNGTVSNQYMKIYTVGERTVFGNEYATFSNNDDFSHYCAEFKAIDDVLRIGINLVSETISATLSNIEIYRIDNPDVLPNTFCDYMGDDVSMFHKCICIGDSLTYGGFNYDGEVRDIIELSNKYSYPAQFSKITGIEVTKMATGGVTSVTWWDNYGEQDMSGHDMAIIQLGVNDGIKLGGWTEASITAFTSIINKLKSDNDGIKIFVASIIPARAFVTSSIIDVNDGIKEFVQGLNDENVILIDINTYGHTDDSIAYNCGHLSAYGYWRLARDYKALISYYISNNKEQFRTVQFIGTDLTYTD